MAGPDTLHAQYTQRAPQWRRCRDAVAGQDAVHKAGAAYLPRLSGQEPADYEAYKLRATWFGATSRTLEGMVGMVFRVAPQTTAPAAMGSILADATMTGLSVNALSQLVLSDVIEVGRGGLLVEYPAASGQQQTLADAAAQGLRPYITTYKAEAIRNWVTARVRNAVVPVLVVLEETYTKSADAWGGEDAMQLRVLALEDGRYVQRIFRAGEGGAWGQWGDDIVPLRNGQALPYIPFLCVGPMGITLDAQRPPMLDLVDVNLSHYRNSADLEHGAHFTGLPTAVVTGYQAEQGEKLTIGSTTAWVFPDPEADAKFLEFTGQGLQALETRCEKKEAQMAALGARMLAPEKTGVESEGALAIRQNGEAAVLAGIAGVVSQAITQALRWCAEWAGISGEITHTLSRDYAPVGMTAQELAEWVKAWQAGAVSFETMFAAFKRGELVDEATTLEDEQARIADAGPVLTAPAATPQGALP